MSKQAKDWIMVRIPRQLHRELLRFREDLQQNYERRGYLWFKPPCEWPISDVIRHLVQLIEKHRDRARRSRRDAKTRQPNGRRVCPIKSGCCILHGLPYRCSPARDVPPYRCPIDCKCHC